MNKISRRSFVKGMVATSILALGNGKLSANTFDSISLKRLKNNIPELSGKEFNLNIGESIVNFTGSPAIATTVNNSISGPTLRWREGDEITINVTNNLKEDASIHWHGIIIPTHMDGVPGISFPGIKPGETFVYKFKVKQYGTYWYHSHSGFQEQTGVHGVIVIEPKKPNPYKYDVEHIVGLSDWSDEKPASIYRKLKLQADYYNTNERTVGNFFEEVKKRGFTKAFEARKMWNSMDMSDRDLSDVTGATYTYLMNGKTPATNWKALFKANQKVLLRFVNTSAMTFFDIRIPGLKMTVVAADGNNIQPVTVDEFRMGVAESYDVIVEPKNNQSYAIFAQSLERSGYAVGSLTYDKNVAATVPNMDKPQNLTMADMGMSMSGMNMNKNSMKKSMGMMNKSDMNMNNANSKKPIPITPLEEDYSGVGTTTKAISPEYRLDDPGVGLRNNGRRVLTYADLRSLEPTTHERYPDREIILHLTGNMDRYMWSINGIKYSDAKPLKFKYGERLRITYINDTMMNHPMHLHGMWSDVETGDDNFLPRKHTVIVQPGSKISFRVNVDAKGSWAYHCHLLYHMGGMFRKVEVV